MKTLYIGKWMIQIQPPPKPPKNMENQEPGIGLFLVSEDDRLIGKLDESRLEALPWYKRLWAKISKRYRGKYQDLLPFEVELTEES